MLPGVCNPLSAARWRGRRPRERLRGGDRPLGPVPGPGEEEKMNVPLPDQERLAEMDRIWGEYMNRVGGHVNVDVAALRQMQDIGDLPPAIEWIQSSISGHPM